MSLRARTTPEQLLEQGDALEPLLAEYNWEDWETRTVHLSLPKFDVVSETDLLDGLEALGVTDVMDPAASDSVSYTHLDVYKRQAYGCAPSAGKACPSRRNTFPPSLFMPPNAPTAAIPWRTPPLWKRRARKRTRCV